MQSLGQFASIRWQSVSSDFPRCEDVPHFGGNLKFKVTVLGIMIQWLIKHLYRVQKSLSYSCTPWIMKYDVASSEPCNNALLLKVHHSCWRLFLQLFSSAFLWLLLLLFLMLWYYWVSLWIVPCVKKWMKFGQQKSWFHSQLIKLIQQIICWKSTTLKTLLSSILMVC